MVYHNRVHMLLASRKMKNILTNPGLIHIREQIFGYFDHKTLENCREVFTKKYGEDWDLWLERLSLVQCILEFGDMVMRYGHILSDVIPGWDNAVKKFGKVASLNDLNVVKGSLKRFEKDHGVTTYIEYLYKPFHYAAKEGHVKLMELLFYTDMRITDGFRGDFTPLITACHYGHTEIAKLMIENRTKHGINIQQSIFGTTALKIVNIEAKAFYCDPAPWKELKDILEKAISADKIWGPKYRLKF